MRFLMLRFVLFVFIVLFWAVPNSYAFDVNENHTGSYIYGMFGFIRSANDTNARTGTVFANSIEMNYGITYGHNVTDWIAPEIQFAYFTKQGNTPSGAGREHALQVRLNAKYSFLTNAAFNQERAWKIYPYAKAGGVAHGLFVNAPNNDDKVGAYGGGFGIGGGLEVNYKALYLGIDISNDFLFLKETRRVIDGVNEIITAGGFEYMPSVQAAVGVHF